MFDQVDIAANVGRRARPLRARERRQRLTARSTTGLRAADPDVVARRRALAFTIQRSDRRELAIAALTRAPRAVAVHADGAGVAPGHRVRRAAVVARRPVDCRRAARARFSCRRSRSSMPRPAPLRVRRRVRRRALRDAGLAARTGSGCCSPRIAATAPFTLFAVDVDDRSRSSGSTAGAERTLAGRLGGRPHARLRRLHAGWPRSVHPAARARRRGRRSPWTPAAGRTRRAGRAASGPSRAVLGRGTRSRPASGRRRSVPTAAKRSPAPRSRGSDALGRHGYGAAVSWSSRARPDWQVAYTYDRWWPILFASIADDTDPFRSGEARSTELNGGVLLPMRRVRRVQSLFGSVHVSTDTVRCDACNQPVDARTARRALRAGYTLNTARSYGYSISREDGWALTTSYEAIRRALGSDGDAGSAIADVRRYQRRRGRTWRDRRADFRRGVVGRRTGPARVHRWRRRSPAGHDRLRRGRNRTGPRVRRTIGAGRTRWWPISSTACRCGAFSAASGLAGVRAQRARRGVRRCRPGVANASSAAARRALSFGIELSADTVLGYSSAGDADRRRRMAPRWSRGSAERRRCSPASAGRFEC